MLIERRQPLPEDIGPDTPLRLDTAAALASPDGGVTARALRREAANGRLTIERVAGKDYTTLGAIEDMRKLCRRPAKQPPAPVRDGSAAQAALLNKLKLRKEEYQAQRAAEKAAKKAVREAAYVRKPKLRAPRRPREPG